MKKIFRYMLLAGVALMAAACEQEFTSTGVGSVDFDINLSADTRAVNGSDFTPETLKVRIYREDGALIRRYTSMEAIPAPMYLVSGAYSILVEAGDRSNTAFIEPTDALELKQQLCYEGQKDFTISAHTTSNIAVNCPSVNTKATVTFDTTNSANENALLTDVKIQLAAMNTTATTVAAFTSDVAAQEAPTLSSNGSMVGYFILPEEVTTLSWAFSATHPEDGAIEKVGTIANVAPGKGYKLAFVYSKTPDGFMAIQVLVDDKVDQVENNFDFKPQPEIMGTGVDNSAVNVYQSGSTVTLTCESINALQTLSLGGVTFFADGAVVEGAIPGLTATLLESTKVQFTLDATYFATLSGAYQTLEFGMEDTGGDYTQKLQFVKTGLVNSATTYDLWKNTATFEAVVTDAASSVVVRYRKQGTSEWAETTLSAAGDITYTGTSTAVWESSWSEKANANIYTPNTAKSFFANSTYEYQLVVDGVAGDKATISTSATQTIPYATFEDTSLSCWGTSNNPAPYWGSGNNTFTKKLCQQGSKGGQQGSYCAVLTATEAVGMLAAGNLFTGSFVFNLSSQTGTVKFGVKYDYEARPSALKLRMWHKIGNVTTTKYASLIPNGQPDEGSVQVVVIDWNSQHEVTSGSSASGVWNPENGPNTVSAGKIVGYGIIYPRGTTSGENLIETEIPIVWYDTTTKPSKNFTLIISAATSRYGDYMNGCNENEMYLDDFRWVY
ncbi:MAG: DUF4493 domain-containing protein [Alistipes sp.]|nr:DUF4493 domain-containing protein [Alistipes sp.]